MSDSISQQFPYQSRRMPVMARNMVAASQPLAAQAGLEMLRHGGNAVDAALAAAITLTVVEPTMNGIGGDAFCIVWDGDRLHGLNASGRSPINLDLQRFRGLNEMPEKGWSSVTVPGQVSGWVELSSRFGELPFDRLFEAAIDYAENGFQVSPITQRLWKQAESEYAGYEDFSVFLPNGRAPEVGELFRSPDHAASLRLIAESRGEAFYRGELAQKFITASEAAGADFTLADLDQHRAEWVELISREYHGYRLHEIPPNGQGLAALLMLGILQFTDHDQHEMDSAEAIHLQLEAMKLAFADAHRYVADGDHLDIEITSLLDDGYLKSRASGIDSDRAGSPVEGVPGKSDTVYLSAADASGMMVSYIQSNFDGFGSGIVIPGTGISLQNR
ncbi:MAG: gamma-glutamyltransferase family protein, partial [Pseudomonadota bacterium]